MASDNDASCVCDPNFAVICNFLERFGKPCGIAYPDFADLQEMIEDTEEDNGNVVSEQLVELHIKLLRKTRKTVRRDKWERALIKFCHGYNSQDGWEIERFGYKKSRTAVKLRLLKSLLEEQFDLNQKFKSEINRLSARELRLEPLGKDKRGLSYWHQLDEHCNLRIYCEDQDEETWQLVAQDRQELVDLIAKLSGSDSENSIEPLINEDSNSLEVEKPIIDTGQVEKSTSDDNENETVNEKDTKTESKVLVSKTKTEIKEVEEETSVSPEIESRPKKTEMADKTDKSSNPILSEVKEEKSEVKVEEKEEVKEEGKEKVKEEEKETVKEEEKEKMKEEKSIENKDIISSPKKRSSSSTISDDSSKYPKKVEDIPIDHSKPISHIQQDSLHGLVDVISRVHGNLSRDLNICVASYRGEDQELDLSKQDKQDIQTHELDLSKKLTKTKIENSELTHLGKSKHSHADSSKKKNKSRSKKVKMDANDEVGEEIVEDVLIVRGEGAGKECQNSPIVESEIVEEVMYFYGEGNGHDCLVTNPQKEEAINSEKAESSDKSSVSENSSSDNTSLEKLQENTAEVILEIAEELPHKSSEETSTTNDSSLDLKENDDTKTCAPLPAAKRFLQTNVNTDLNSEQHIDDNNKNDKAASIFNATVNSNEPADNVATPIKKTMFFFGPGSLTNKPETIITEKSFSSVEDSDLQLKSPTEVIETKDLNITNVDNANDKENKVTEIDLKNQPSANTTASENIEVKNEKQPEKDVKTLVSDEQKSLENPLDTFESKGQENVSLKSNSEISSTQSSNNTNILSEDSATSGKFSTSASLPLELTKSANQNPSKSLTKEIELTSKSNETTVIKTPIEEIKKLPCENEKSKIEPQAPQVDFAKRKVEDFTSISKLIAKDDEKIVKVTHSIESNLSSTLNIVSTEITSSIENSKSSGSETVTVKASEPISATTDKKLQEFSKEVKDISHSSISPINVLTNTESSKEVICEIISEKSKNNSETKEDTSNIVKAGKCQADTICENISVKLDSKSKIDKNEFVDNEEILNKTKIKTASKVITAVDELNISTTEKNSIETLKNDSQISKELDFSKETVGEKVVFESKPGNTVIEKGTLRLEKTTKNQMNMKEKEVTDGKIETKKDDSKLVEKSTDNQLVKNKIVSKPVETNFHKIVSVSSPLKAETEISNQLNETKNESKDLPEISVNENDSQNIIDKRVNCKKNLSDDIKINSNDTELISSKAEENAVEQKSNDFLTIKTEIKLNKSEVSDSNSSNIKEESHGKIELIQNLSKVEDMSLSATPEEIIPNKDKLKEEEPKIDSEDLKEISESSDDDNNYECSMSVHDDEQESEIKDSDILNTTTETIIINDSESNLKNPPTKIISEIIKDETISSELSNNEINSSKQVEVIPEKLKIDSKESTDFDILQNETTILSVNAINSQDSVLVDTDNSNDVQEIEENDPLACTDGDTINLPEDLEKTIENSESILPQVEEIKPISVLAETIDETIKTKAEIQTSRKRTRGSDCANEAEDIASEKGVGRKRAKLRSKRNIDKELRKSIEKKKEEERASGSEDEAQLQINDFKMEEKPELKSEPIKSNEEIEAPPEEPTVRVTRRGIICHPPRPKKTSAAQSDSNSTKATPTNEVNTTEKPVATSTKKSKKGKAKKEPKTSSSEKPIEKQDKANEKQNKAIEKPDKTNEKQDKAKENQDKTTKKQEKPIEKPVKRRKTLLGLDIDEDYVVPIEENDRGVRQSRRIAQIKIKEEAERRKLEEITLSEMKAEQKKKSKKDEDKDYKSEKRKKKGKNVSDDESTNDVPEEIVKKKRKKKKGLKFDEANPWKSSSGSSSSEDDDEEPEVEEEPSDEENLVFKSDHEFSPESDLEDGAEAEPLKRARTAKVESDVEETDEYACQKCGKLDHPEWILLCDSCDSGWHCSCLRPALFVIPEGDWFCPPCQHKTLIIRLQEKLEEFDKLEKQIENEELQRQRLEYVNISTANILTDQNDDGDEESNDEEDVDDSNVPQRAKSDKSHSGGEENSDDSESDDDSSGVTETSSSSSSVDDEPIYKLRERRQANSYRFNEYDDLINSAIKDDLDSVKGAGNQGRGKDISTIVNAEKEEKEALNIAEEFGENKNADGEYKPEHDSNAADNEKTAFKAESSDDEIPRVRKRFGKKKHAKLTSLDISSEDDADSDEDFKGSSSDEEDEDFDESGLSEDSEEMGYRRKNKNDGPVRRSSRRRATRYDREFINDDSDEDYSRSKKPRSIWEDSYSEESDGSWGRKKKRTKKPRRTTTTSSKSKKKRTSKSKKKKHDSDSEVYRERKPKKPKIVYGGLNEADEDNEEPVRRTRGRKINYLEALGSDSEEDGIRPSVKPIIESEEEYVAEEDEKDSDQENLNLQLTKHNTVDILNPDLMKLQTLSSSLIPPKMHDTGIDDFNEDLDSDEDLLEDDEISKVGIGSLNSDELGDLDEDELAELMMGDEAFATKQLDFATQQIAKDKKKKERELKKQTVEKKIKDIDDPFLSKQLVENPLLHNILAPDQQPKKRGRKSKRELEEIARLSAPQLQSQNISSLTVAAMQSHNIPMLSAENSLHSVDGIDTSMSMSEDEKSSEASTPSLAHLNIRTNLTPGEPSKLSPSLNSSGSIDGTPKRRGRGKGKKTLAAEAAAAAGKGPGEENSTLVSGKLGIAPPPQPFTQSQPSPSVITRMLQSQPVLPQNYNQMPGHKFFPDAPPNIRGPQPPQFSSVGPRGRIPSPYRPQIATVPHFPPGTTAASPSHRPQITTSGAPIFHSAHHPLDPSPSGGGPITLPVPSRDGNSPAIIPQSSNAPLANKNTTVPVGRFPPETNLAVPTTTSIPPPQLRHHIPYTPANLPHPAPTLKPPFPPYPPQLPPNYHYGAYPPSTLPPGEDAIPPSTYQGSPYPEPYTPENTSIPPPENSNNKPPYDEEGSGEFGGLVSYFSSQREDDLDS